MKLKEIYQLEFSTVLFDTLFGLILFFSLDSFLTIKQAQHFIFYLFTIIITVHWWLIFKSADDAFDKEVTSSTVDLMFGIIYIIFIEYIILSAKIFNYQAATGFLLAVFFIDLIWALIWRYIGEWSTRDKEKIKLMETELNNNIKINIGVICLFIMLISVAGFLNSLMYVCSFIILYFVYILLTFKYKIINLKIF